MPTPVPDPEILTNLEKTLGELDRREIPCTLGFLAHVIDDINQQNGWNDEKTQGDWAALAHSEISEAYEEYRNGHGTQEIYSNPDKPNKPEGMAVEYADTLIRILHWFAQHDMSPEVVVIAKLQYNMTRGYRHGGKVA